MPAALVSGALARIVLRYLAAALVTRGLVSADIGATLSGDADLMSLLEPALGVAIAAAAEGWYMLARRFGWAR